MKRASTEQLLHIALHEDCELDEKYAACRELQRRREMQKQRRLMQQTLFFRHIDSRKYIEKAQPEHVRSILKLLR